MDHRLNGLNAAGAARAPHPLIIMAAIAVTLFSLAGIAAIMGWVPTSKGDPAMANPLAAAAPASVTPATSEPEKVSVVQARPAARPAKPAEKQSITKQTIHPAPVTPAPSEPVQIAAVAPAPPAPAVAATPEPAKVACNDCGTIETIRAVQKQGEASGAGAAAGGVLGGVVGHQVGNGRGRDIMTVLGAVGGAIAGHQVEKNAKTTTAYEITVRFEDGTTRSLQQPGVPSWRIGDKVRVINSEIVASR